MSDIDTCQTSDTFLFRNTDPIRTPKTLLFRNVDIPLFFRDKNYLTFYKFCDAESGMDSGGACDNALWIYVIRFLSL